MFCFCVVCKFGTKFFFFLRQNLAPSVTCNFLDGRQRTTRDGLHGRGDEAQRRNRPGRIPAHGQSAKGILGNAAAPLAIRSDAGGGRTRGASNTADSGATAHGAVQSKARDPFPHRTLRACASATPSIHLHLLHRRRRLDSSPRNRR